MAELVLDRLRRRFGDVVAVDDVSLTVPDGQLACLLGPSGCGKTTTLRMIAGLETPDAGTIRLGDDDITRRQARDRQVGMMFQGYALYPHLSVRDNIGYPLRVRGTAKTERDRRISEVAELTGVSELLGRRVDEISGGQAQRVALARAIVQRPRLFLLDEPISALDAAVRSRMRGEIKRLQRLIATTTVVVSHDQLDALSMADLLVVLRDGLVQQVGPPTEVHDRPANAWVAGFIGEPQMNLLPARLDSQGGVTGLRLLGQWIALPDEVRAAVGAAGVTEVTVGIRPASLRLHPSASDAGSGRIPATVYAAQPQGTRILYELDASGTILRAETDSETRFDLDSVTWLEVLPRGVHVFRADAAATRIA